MLIILCFLHFILLITIVLKNKYKIINCIKSVCNNFSRKKLNETLISLKCLFPFAQKPMGKCKHFGVNVNANFKGVVIQFDYFHETH